MRPLLVVLILVLTFQTQLIEARLRALQYDVECPFLTEKEYEDRMQKGRCLFRAPKNETNYSRPTSPPPSLKHGVFIAGVQKRLLKFVYFGKQRTIRINMRRGEVDRVNAIEGSFLELRCDADKKEWNETLIRWFFDGLPLDPSFFNWRVQSTNKNQRLLLAPTLAQYDSGLFECFVDEDFRGSVQLKIQTIWRSVFIGFENYLIGMAFSFPLTLIAAAYRLYRPPGPMNELFDEEDDEWMSMEFDEMMLNLNKVERI